MEAKIQEVYVSQQARTQDLSDRTYEKNTPSKQMTPKYFSTMGMTSSAVTFPPMVRVALFGPYHRMKNFLRSSTSLMSRHRLLAVNKSIQWESGDKGFPSH